MPSLMRQSSKAQTGMPKLTFERGMHGAETGFSNLKMNRSRSVNILHDRTLSTQKQSAYQDINKGSKANKSTKKSFVTSFRGDSMYTTDYWNIKRQSKFQDQLINRIVQSKLV